jgi:signal transduction histidine kinase
MAEGIRPIVNDLASERTGQVSETESGFLGSMREDAELLDAIVEDAMRRRRLQAGRPRPEDFAALEAITEETGRPLNELLDEALHLLLERLGRHPPARDKDSGRGDV